MRPIHSFYFIDSNSKQRHLMSHFFLVLCIYVRLFFEKGWRGYQHLYLKNIIMCFLRNNHKHEALWFIPTVRIPQKNEMMKEVVNRTPPTLPLPTLPCPYPPSTETKKKDDHLLLNNIWDIMIILFKIWNGTNQRWFLFYYFLSLTYFIFLVLLVMYG